MAKETCDGLRSISIYKLKDWKYLSYERTDGTITWTSVWGDRNRIGIEVSADLSSVRLKYSNTNRRGDKDDLDYEVRLTSTLCYFGGKRYWFVCPLIINNVPCQRRVALLYHGGKYFGCRKCHDLVYESQQHKAPMGVGLSGKELNILWNYEEEVAKLRTKHWKGQPTKRYAKLLEIKAHGERCGGIAAIESSLCI